MIDIVVAQLIAIVCALAALGAAWAMDRQGLRHAHERELWRAERQVLQARALRPAPSIRRPSAPADTVEVAPTERVVKEAELRRLAGRISDLQPEVPRGFIVPTDL